MTGVSLDWAEWIMTGCCCPNNFIFLCLSASWAHAVFILSSKNSSEMSACSRYGLTSRLMLSLSEPVNTVWGHVLHRPWVVFEAWLSFLWGEEDLSVSSQNQVSGICVGLLWCPKPQRSAAYRDRFISAGYHVVSYCVLLLIFLTHCVVINWSCKAHTIH